MPSNKPLFSITITNDKAKLARLWDNAFAEKHAGKTYQDACINFTGDQWAAVDSAGAKFSPDVFTAKASVLLMVADTIPQAEQMKADFESKGGEVKELYQNPDNFNKIDIYLSLNPMRAADIIGETPHPRDWV